MYVFRCAVSYLITWSYDKDDHPADHVGDVSANSVILALTWQAGQCFGDPDHHGRSLRLHGPIFSCDSDVTDR